MNDAVTTIKRHHHLTMCSGDAQEDYDFHTKVLGLKSVKKTALYDGKVPVYHLYYGNDTGEESTLLTSFPMRQSGRMGRKGSGQVKTISLSIPSTSYDYWKRRLRDQGFTASEAGRFGDRILRFAHPCGIEYELVCSSVDTRTGYSNSPVGAENGILGTYGVTVSVRDLEDSDAFMQLGWGARRTGSDGVFTRYDVGEGGPGAIVDFQIEPDLPQGSWTFGEGVVHHVAFEVANHSVQDAVKGQLEGLGFTDVSDRKDRGYFDSIYVRTPGGAMFEATVSKPEGFTIDEPYEKLGSEIQVPPVFADKREWMKSFLDPINY